MIKLNDYVTRSEDLAFRIIQEEAIILTAQDRVIHTLNQVGTRIWELLKPGMKVGELIEKVCDEYEVDRIKAEEDVMKFLTELGEKGIIVVKGSRDDR
jgi:hypothetical protein